MALNLKPTEYMCPTLDPRINGGLEKMRFVEYFRDKNEKVQRIIASSNSKQKKYKGTLVS